MAGRIDPPGLKMNNTASVMRTITEGDQVKVSYLSKISQQHVQNFGVVTRVQPGPNGEDPRVIHYRTDDGTLDYYDAAGGSGHPSFAWIERADAD